MPVGPVDRTGRWSWRARATLLLVVAALLAWSTPALTSSAAVYKWVDANGVTHLSSEKPPAGTQYERIAMPGATRTSVRPSSTRGGATHVASVSSPQQAARRKVVIEELQTRECVVALEAIDRHAHGTAKLEPADLKRLQQTAERNCSRDPATRREQQEMAARLRVAKGGVCVDARNALAEMLEPGRKPRREQLKAQQEFIEAHCRMPVR